MKNEKEKCNAKTYFLTVQLGAEIKNWFHGDFYQLAKQNPDVCLVVFTYPHMVENYRKDFGHERCIFEVFPDLKFEKRPIRQIFRIVSQASVPTPVVWFRLLYWRRNGGSLINFLIKRAIWALSHTRMWRMFLRFAEFRFFRDEKAWAPYFEKYNPTAVFAPTTYRDYDTTMLKYAKRHGIPTVGMLRGWDNMSSKAFLTVHPDALCVQNTTMVKEAMEWNDIPRARIHVVGFPYFDHYVDPSWTMTRQEVAEAIGADPKKKWIGFFVGGIFVGFLRAGDGTYQADILDRAVKRGEFGDAVILASIHPGFRGEWSFNPSWTSIQPLRFANAWGFSLPNMKLTMNFIRECAVAVDFGSSLSLETAIFNRPTVFVGFNGSDDTKIPWHKKISAAYQYYTHLRYILDVRGVEIASSEKELVEKIKKYIESPSLHHEGRARVVKNLVNPLDGKAGERVFQILLTSKRSKNYNE